MEPDNTREQMREDVAACWLHPNRPAVAWSDIYNAETGARVTDGVCAECHTPLLRTLAEEG